MSVQEVARLLGLTRDGVYQIVRRGRLNPARKQGSRGGKPAMVFSPDEVRAFIDARKKARRDA